MIDVDALFPLVERFGPSPAEILTPPTKDLFLRGCRNMRLPMPVSIPSDAVVL
jgi:hypothetical protein